MYTVDSYPLAVALCFGTMLCWGSWANTRKLAGPDWPLSSFYWGYAVGVLLMAGLLGITLGSHGSGGRWFIADLAQADEGALGLAFAGGALFNLANILVMLSLEAVGMAVAFPVGVGTALVIGVVVNYCAAPAGNATLLFLGVAGVATAILCAGLAAGRRGESSVARSRWGTILAVAGGVLLGFFYRLVAASMSSDFSNLAPGRLGPYSAVFVFSCGLLASQVLFSRLLRSGDVESDSRDARSWAARHVWGLVGGMVWSLGMSLSLLASGRAGFAVSYGLGQGATMVSVLWGLLVWKEFHGASVGVMCLTGLMFACFCLGLGLIVVSRIA